ncbi:MAG: class I SAM-dependent methyltransferase [Phycisphaerales bacterium]|nr:class I SAM-dependent methyltransferase [Phycisphaerales bacterium]
MNEFQLYNQIRAASMFADTFQRVQPVQGFLNPLEGFALFLLAAEGDGVGEVVEIGSFMGLSTCWLAAGSRSAGREKITAIDHFKGSPEHQKGGTHEIEAIVREGSTYQAFLNNLRGVGVHGWVQPIVAGSERAAADWKKPIRLLFIDGDHSYEASKKDFEVWSPHIVPNGLIAFHDVGPWEGVTRFYQELAQNAGGKWRECLAMQSLRVIQRIA